MTDDAPSWQTDPTGRHDHRYWDGAAWTEHVSDAGVATTDPYDGGLAPDGPAEPAAPQSPVAAGPSTGGDASTSPHDDPAPTVQQAMSALESSGAPTETVTSGSATAASSDEAAADPEPTSSFQPADEPTATMPSYAAPVPPIAATPRSTAASPDDLDPPADPTATSELDPASTPDAHAATSPYGSSAFDDAPPPAGSSGQVDPADAPTLAQRVGGDPTSEWPVSPSSAEGPPPPTFTPPEPTGPTSGGGGSKRPLLIGLGVLVLVAVAVALFAGGDDGDDEDLAASIAAQIQEGEQNPLNEEEARCLADELIEELGANRLAGVDFTAEEPPAELADELNDAFVAAIPTCDIGSGDPDDGTAGSSDDALTSEQIDEFRALLAEQYRESLGLSEAKSACLADVMADAVEAGDLRSDDSFDQFFEYLDTCDISVSELGGATGATP